MQLNELKPAEHVEPAPEDGWKAADLDEDELVDDDFVAADCGRTYAPLAPEDEKLYPSGEC